MKTRTRKKSIKGSNDDRCAPNDCPMERSGKYAKTNNQQKNKFEILTRKYKQKLMCHAAMFLLRKKKKDKFWK